ncbi:MAG: response regulator [Deltaproteobacteria bacterium]|nr:response regulator [Deltaproteobacteria bacterium]
MPWTFKETLFVCFTTFTMYLLACLLHKGTPISWNILFNNFYFLFLTAVICLTASFYISRRRFEEFRLRYELNIRNKELARSYEQLEEMDRLKTEFFANVSHELRTPLTLIISPVQDLLHREDILPGGAKNPLKMVEQNALRLLKLINDLLEIVRLEEGGSAMKRQPINLVSFISGLMESIRHLAEAKNLSINLQGDEDSLCIQGDPERLEKVFLNLFTNAIKFTPEGGSITTRWTNGDNSAIIEVEDTGIGISDKDLPYIFDRFRQADGSSTRRFQGLGIGLSLARAVVEEHEGTLTVQSKVGKGTIFRIALPADMSAVSCEQTATDEVHEKDPIVHVYQAAERAIRIPSSSSEKIPGIVGTGEFTILIVEDESDMRQFLVSKLAIHYRVIQTGDGNVGLDMVKQHRPDLVLLDLMLPGMDGLTLCSVIKTDPEMRQIKVILLTARLDEESKISALERGADDFITKPFSTMEVKTRIHNLLKTARLEQDLRKQNMELEDTLSQLKDTEAQLVQSEKMGALGTLAAGLLHEINNPLNFTLTALHVAMNQINHADNEIKETLEDIDMGMTRIRDIVSDLRSFTRSPGENERQPFMLSEAYQTALNLVSHEIKDFRINTSIYPDYRVVGSRTQVTHVFMNLLVNSAKALKKILQARDPEIRVTVLSQNNKVLIKVWDNGSGISAWDLPRVFDPFFTTQDVGQGTGLGLSICHTIIKNHNGRITIQSQEGEWTEVCFDLPLFQKEKDASGPTG